MNILYSFSGNILSLLSNFIWLTIFNRNLSLSTVDSYLILLSISAPVFVLFNLDLRRLASIDIDINYSNLDYFLLRTLSNFIACLISLLLVMVLYDINVNFVIAILASKVFEAISELIFGLYTRVQNHWLILVNKTVKFFIAFATLIILEFDWFILDFNRLVFSYFLSFFLPFILVDCLYLVRRSKKLTFSLLKIKKLGNASKELGTEAFLLTAASSYPVIYLSFFGTNGDITLFGSIAYVVTAIQVTFASLFYATTGDIKRSFNKFPKYTLISIRKISLITAFLFSLVVYFSSGWIAILLQTLFSWDAELDIIETLLNYRVFGLVLVILSSIFSTSLLFNGELKVQKSIRALKFIILVTLTLFGNLLFDVNVIWLTIFIMFSNFIETMVFFRLINRNINEL